MRDGAGGSTEAPQLLFDFWSTRHRVGATQSTGVWNQGYQEITLKRSGAEEQSGETSCPRPRMVPSRLHQLSYMLERSFRQHDQTLFVAALFALFMSGLLFGLVFEREYANINIPYKERFRWLGGFNFGEPLYFLLVAAYFRRLFADERPNYQREFKVGVSTIGYWGARNLYCLCLLPFMALAFNCGTFFPVATVQSFWIQLVSQLMVGYFWSGAAMMISTLITSELSQTLVLLFWPLVEPAYNGTFPIGVTVKARQGVAWFAASRWYYQSLLASEILELPANIVRLDVVQKLLRERLMHTSKNDIRADQAVAFVVLFAFGTGFRLICLAIIALEKYSSGGSYWNQSNDVARRLAYAITSKLNGWYLAEDVDAAANYEDHVLGKLASISSLDPTTISAPPSLRHYQQARASSARARLVTSDGQQQKITTELATVSVK